MRTTAAAKLQLTSMMCPTRPQKEGVADQTFGRIATMSTTVASLGTTAATVYMLLQRNKNN